MRKLTLRSNPWLLFIAVPVAACSSSSKNTPGDAATDVRGGHHDAGADGSTHPRDATSHDTGTHKDTGTRDSKGHEPDAGELDSGEPDSGEPDSGPEGDSGPSAFFDAAPGCAIGAMGEALDLKCTGLYSDWSSKTIAPGVEPYTPGLQLWSDGAVKNRWIALPPGQQIDTSDMDEWTFPVGTRIWKEFNLPTSESDGGLRRIETRLIWKFNSSTWYLTTYQWTADGETDATENTNGMLNANGLGYEIPNQFDCGSCHYGRNDDVMGFEAVSLAQPNAQGLAMPELLDAGLLTNPPEAGSLAIPGDPTAATALGYLHVNCGIACHNENGQALANNSDFWMRLSVATLGSVQTTEAYKTGWNQQSDWDIPGVGDKSMRIAACSVPTSAAYYRASHRDGVDGTPDETQMPPFDTHKIDDAGLEKFAAWINQGCDAGPDAKP